MLHPPYPEGIPSFSPGLARRSRAYPGSTPLARKTLKGLRPQRAFTDLEAAFEYSDPGMAALRAQPIANHIECGASSDGDSASLAPRVVAS